MDCISIGPSNTCFITSNLLTPPPLHPNHACRKNLVDSYRGTELERKVKDLTSAENWGVSSTAKGEIARATYDYQSYREVVPLIWKRLQEPGQNWIIIFKCLSLFEFLIRNGAMSVVEELRERQYHIRQFCDFHYDDGERERGNGIRETSKRIIEVINDQEQLEKVRAEAKQNRDKYTALSSNGSAGSSFGGFGSDSYNNRYGEDDNPYSSASSSSASRGSSANASSSKPKQSSYNSGYDADAENEAKASASSSSKTASSATAATTATTEEKPKKKVVKKVVKKAADASSAASAPAATADDFDADFDSIAAESAKSINTQTAATTNKSSSAAFDDFPVAFDNLSISAPAPARAPAPTFVSAPPAVPVSSFDVLSSLSAPTTSAPAAPAANFDVFSNLNSSSSSSSTPSVSSPTDDLFGEFTSATDGKDSTKKAIDKKIQDQFHGLIDLDDIDGSKSASKPAPQVNVFRAGYGPTPSSSSGSSSAFAASTTSPQRAAPGSDPFAQLVSPSSGPVPGAMVPGMGGMGMPMAGMGMAGMGMGVQPGYGMPMAGMGGMGMGGMGMGMPMGGMPQMGMGYGYGMQQPQQGGYPQQQQQQQQFRY